MSSASSGVASRRRPVADILSSSLATLFSQSMWVSAASAPSWMPQPQKARPAVASAAVLTDTIFAGEGLRGGGGRGAAAAGAVGARRGAAVGGRGGPAGAAAAGYGAIPGL